MTKDDLESQILKAMLLEATTAAPAAPGYQDLARAVGDRLQELGLPLDGLTAPASWKRRTVKLDRRIALAEEKRREAWDALSMVRRAIEELGVGLVEFDATVGPEAHHEAEPIIRHSQAA